MAREAIEFVLSVGLGIIFLASAIPKLRHPRGFVLTVWEYQVLPTALGTLYARLLPPIEFLVALLLLTGTVVRLASAVSSLLLLSFVVAIGVNLARGRDIDCGCFGERRNRRVGLGLLFQDLGMLALSSVSLLLAAATLGVAPWSVFRLGDGTISAAPAVALCLAASGLGSILPGSSRSLRRRSKVAFRRTGGRWDAQTTVD